MSDIHGWQMVAPERLEPARRAMRALRPEEVLVRVAGCGVCHTDLGFFHDHTKTRHPLPLILGHEISGVVEDAGSRFSSLVGQPVVVPAVIPCGQCPSCKAGRATICPSQVMPGNDVDGGFASHVIVPGVGLCPVPGATSDMDAPIAGRLTLRMLAVVADAVTTPYQAIARSELRPGDVAVVVGVGGVGGYAAQIAALSGAHVVAVDVDARKLETARSRGAGLVLDAKAQPAKALRNEIRAFCKQVGASDRAWKIFECSGTSPGQKTAWDLLVHGASLMVVGYAPDPVEVRLSNLMAFDARAIGNWGCDPALYPAALALVTSGKLDVAAQVELRPLSTIAATFAEMHGTGAPRRFVLVPET